MRGAWGAAVTLNGRSIELESATKVHKVKGPGGVMATLTLGRNIAGYGTAVNFTTPTASLFAYLVPSGLDTVGFLQPSYLNFDLTLLKIPSRRIEVRAFPLPTHPNPLLLSNDPTCRGQHVQSPKGKVKSTNEGLS